MSKPAASKAPVVKAEPVQEPVKEAAKDPEQQQIAQP